MNYNNKISIPLNTSPADIWKYMENKRAEIEWAARKETTPIPKVEIPKRLPLSAGVWNMCRQFLP